MNNDIHKAYKQIKVSDGLHERLVAIPEQMPKGAGRLIKAAVAIAAALALIFSADMISYAVTGSGVAERVQSAFDSDRPEIKGVEINGRMVDSYEVSQDGKTIIINDSLYPQMYIETDDSPEHITIQSEPQLSVRKSGGSVFLAIGSAGLELDITKDIADGQAKGSFIIDGESYTYCVTENDGEYTAEYI